jgi:hypothetical protein
VAAGGAATGDRGPAGAVGPLRREPLQPAGLHAALLGRMVLGNKVIDHERIIGLGSAPMEAAAVYEVGAGGLIAAVWFFNAG